MKKQNLIIRMASGTRHHVRKRLMTIWKALTYREGKFYAPHFWSNVFLLLAVATWMEKLSPEGDVIVSDTLFLGMLGFIATWEGVFKVYNYFNEKNGNGHEFSGMDKTKEAPKGVPMS